MDQYTIYVVNRTAAGQAFFCFLGLPLMQGHAGAMYAHSSLCLQVAPQAPGAPERDRFRIPLRYVLHAATGTQPVGLDAVVATSAARDVDLGDQWRAVFADPARRESAVLTQFGSAAPAPGLVFQASRYDRASEGASAWFASQGFGVRTGAGVMGLTWPAAPGTTLTIIPQLRFHVAIGPYAADRLVDLAMVSLTSQQVDRLDFDDALCCTVTLATEGGWSIARGLPRA